MPSVCIYFQVHQPYRLRHYSFFDIGLQHIYDDEEDNRQIFNSTADKCYLPTNDILLKLINEYDGDFRLAFSITGVTLERMEKYRPDVLKGFQRLADTGAVEFLSETYYHSLAFIFSTNEFKKQIALHTKKIKELFGQRPVTFRNTGLIYKNELAALAEKMGYKAILAEGADKIPGCRSPNFVYRPAGCSKIKLLLKNYRLSDDITFLGHRWSKHPFTADKLAHCLRQINTSGEIVNLFLDYEIFGERRETGMGEFLKALPFEIIKHTDLRFMTPAEVTRTYEPVVSLDVPDFVSRGDTDMNLTTWLGNAMQEEAARVLYDMENAVRSRKDGELLHTWRKLQTSDHFYSMCAKWLGSGDAHNHFNPYESPYDACISYMNILEDLSRVLAGASGRDARRRKSNIGKCDKINNSARFRAA
jgi:alpha-amylase